MGLEKTRIILHKHPDLSATSDIYFGGEDFLTDQDSKVGVFLTRDLFEEMGQPREITVTVQPGDDLNGHQSWCITNKDCNCKSGEKV